MSRLTLSVLTTPNEIASIENEWHALGTLVEGAAVFQSWEWVSSWYEHFGVGKHLQVLAVRDGAGQLVAVAPCSRSSSRGGVFRLLHLLGRGNDLTEYVQALVHPDHARPVARLLVDAWHRMSDQWDLLVLPSLPNDEHFLAHLRRHAETHGYRMSEQTHVRMTRALPQSWQQFYRSLSKSMKDNVNNYVNRLRRAGHQERLSVVEDPADLDHALDVFLDLHRRRAEANLGRRHENRFATEQRRAFLRTVARRLFARDALWPCFLTIDGEVVAAQLCLAHQQRLYLYYSGFDPAWARNGVMTILTRRCIERAIELGYRELDLLLGLDQEKQRWGATPGLVFNVALASPRLRSQTAFHLYRARHAMAAWITNKSGLSSTTRRSDPVPSVTSEPT